METTYRGSDGNVTVDSQGVTLEFHPDAGKGSDKVTIAYGRIESVSFLHPGPAAPGHVIFHVPGDDEDLAPEKDHHCMLVTSPEAVAAAREYVTVVRSKMAGRSATATLDLTTSGFINQPHGLTRDGSSRPARSSPPGIPPNKKLPTGEMLRDLEWPDSPSDFTSAHGYYWSEKERLWVRDPSAPASGGERVGMAFVGLCLIAVIVAVGFAVVQFFGWIGSDGDDGRGAQLSGWYADNPGDSNPTIAEDYAAACGAVPPPVQSGELVEEDGGYVYP